MAPPPPPSLYRDCFFHRFLKQYKTPLTLILLFLAAKEFGIHFPSFRSQPVKTDDISRPHHWFAREMTCEKQPDVTTQIRVTILIGLGNFTMHAARPITSGKCNVLSMEFLYHGNFASLVGHFNSTLLDGLGTGWVSSP